MCCYNRKLMLFYKVLFSLMLKVEQLVLAAEKMGFHVIPLIQTFGHLEALLKQQQWAHLREDHAYPDAICPSQPGTMPLLREMMRQVNYFYRLF